MWFSQGTPVWWVGILWHKTCSHVIERISKDTEGRAITIKLNVNIDSQNLLITCVYFPCADTPIAYNPSVGPIHAYINDILESFPNCLHMIVGDFNFQCRADDYGCKSF